MTTITIGLITCNDSEAIARTLEQLYQFSNEIIVVDCNSVDDTIAIASHFRAKIHEADNISNKNIKNFIIDESKSQYVLFIDCGELLITPEYLFDTDLEDDIYAIPKSNTSEFMYCIKTNSLIQYDGNFPINKEDAVVLYMDNEV